MTFRAASEAIFYDLDGSLTDTGITEDYTQGGNVIGSSLVGRSHFLPGIYPEDKGSDDYCEYSDLATTGVGAAVCRYVGSLQA